MKIIECQQGSDAWKEIRAKYFTASEAPAMLGLSKYKSRAELLREKATGITAEVDSFKQAAFDRGHEAEAVARPLAEAYLQEDLYPCTGSLEVEGLSLLASFDGLTMDESTAWENKLHSESLAAMLDRLEIDGTYWPQLEQQLLVSGAVRVLFTTCDGEKIVKQRWYESQPERRAQLLAGWHQFAEDLKTYVPPEVIPAAVATPQMQLPAVSVQVQGGVAVVDNLSLFGDALQSYVAKINKSPETDQDFADLEATVKTLKAAEDALEAAKANALGQVQSIDQMKRTADQLQELARANRLTVEKLVKAEKENRRNAIVQAGVQAVSQHIADLNTRLTKPYMPSVAYDFGAKVKGLKTIASIQNAVDTELARVKIEANAVADRIDANLKTLVELGSDHKFLFADVATIVQKAPDDLTALVKSRIAEHKESEAKRLEAERARIRAEEEARAAAKVKAEQEEAARKAEAEERGRQEAERLARNKAEAERLAAEQAAERAAATVAPVAATAAPITVAQVLHAAAPEAIAAALTDTGRMIRLGEINSELGFTVTADFLDALGFPAQTAKNAKLYRACDFPRICAAIAKHCNSVAATGMKEAA